MKRSEITIPSGGPRNVSPDIGRIFLQQIEMWTCTKGAEIKKIGTQQEDLLEQLAPEQRRIAHAIARALANLTDDKEGERDVSHRIPQAAGEPPAHHA